MNPATTLFWLALTVYHEARGERVEGQKAVVKVILNRAKKNGWPVSDVVKARKQFSCYNDGLNDPKVWVREVETFGRVCVTVAEAHEEWLAGIRLAGATHYYAIKGMVGGKPPYWAAGMEFITEIQGHRFLKEK